MLLKHAALSCAVATVLALILALAVASPQDAVATVLGAVIASADFMAIVWIITGMLAPGTSTPSKIALSVLMLGKLGFVGALLWSVIVRHGMDGLGVPLGICAGVAGFTWGMVRAQGSAEGRAAMDAEEQQVLAEGRAGARSE